MSILEQLSSAALTAAPATPPTQPLLQQLAASISAFNERHPPGADAAGAKALADVQVRRACCVLAQHHPSTNHCVNKHVLPHFKPAGRPANQRKAASTAGAGRRKSHSCPTRRRRRPPPPPAAAACCSQPSSAAAPAAAGSGGCQLRQQQQTTAAAVRLAGYSPTCTSTAAAALAQGCLRGCAAVLVCRARWVEGCVMMLMEAAAEGACGAKCVQ